MAYPDLPPGDTFWRCRQCGNETLFRASGTANVACVQCGLISTVEELLEGHARAYPELKSAAH